MAISISLARFHICLLVSNANTGYFLRAPSFPIFKANIYKASCVDSFLWIAFNRSRFLWILVLIRMHRYCWSWTGVSKAWPIVVFSFRFSLIANVQSIFILTLRSFLNYWFFHNLILFIVLFFECIFLFLLVRGGQPRLLVFLVRVWSFRGSPNSRNPNKFFTITGKF